MAGWLRRKVLVPVDLSDRSIEAVGEALKMVESPGDITVLHVLPELSPLEPGEMWSTITDESRKQHVTEALEKRLASAGYKGVQVAAEVGSPGHAIVDVAEQIGADTIVIPSRASSRIAHFLLGSVAERVVRHAKCPVVVLH